MSSLTVWLDPINRDAQFVRLMTFISVFSEREIIFYTTQRENISIENRDTVKSFFPTFLNVNSKKSGKILWNSKFSLISNYLSSINSLVDYIDPNDTIIYTGMFFPELESLGIKILRKKCKNINVLIHNFRDVGSTSNFVSTLRKKLFLSQFNKYIFLSEHVKQNGVKNYGISDKKTVVGVHPHFNPALKNLAFDGVLAESLSKFSQGKPALSYISRLDNAHGIDLYLQIIRRCLDKNINICGVIIGRQGTDLSIDDYKCLLNKYQLDDTNIYLKLGTYSYEELLSVLSITDCVLAPYRFISQSGAIALALGEKIPVIASNVGANSEMIRDNINGLLFDVEDIDSVVDKIALIYSQGISIKQNFPFNESFNNHLDPHQWLNSLLHALD